jgi:peptidoglycan/LPS O-acetylase OafA/YrhL
LDGLRGVAILLVLLYHSGTRVVSGFIGVDIFFVLSGFLITTLLAEELERRGRVDLLGFFRRRMLRLLPALLAVTTILVGGTYLVRSPYFAEALRESLIALFYSMNWFKAYGHIPENNYLGHTWSLSIEEQFYLVWPLLLAGMTRVRIPRGWILALVSAGVLASAAMRGCHWLFYRNWARVYHGLDSRADALLSGCLLGLVLMWKPPSGLRPDWVRVGGWAGTAAILALALVPLSGDVYLVAGIPLLNLSVTVVLAALVIGPPTSLLHRVFELRMLRWIGRISYGLYLWHVLVPHLLMKLRMHGRPWTMILEIALSFALAAASYYALEIHFLKRKRKGNLGEGIPPLDAGVLRTPGPQGSRAFDSLPGTRKV